MTRGTRNPTSYDGWLGLSLARGFALFIGGLTALNLLGELIRPGFDTSLWLLDLRWMPDTLAFVFLALTSVLLLTFSARPIQSRWRRWMTCGAALALTATAAANAATYYWLLIHGMLAGGSLISFSLLVVLAGLSILTGAAQRLERLPSKSGLGALLAAAGCVALLPLCQMLLFGKTNYARTADAAVVFGARTYANGKPSTALADRVRTASQLYLDGHVRHLIMSGGPGDGDIHETEAMRRMAVNLGVANEDISIDSEGLNTRATVDNTAEMFPELEAKTIIAISTYFHLPRVKMAYQRAGVDVLTVPAQEAQMLRATPYLLFRETAALWVYYGRP